MQPSHPPTFIVNHGGVHSRCNQSLKKSEIRIESFESLKLVAEPFQIYYHHCQDNFTATTIDVWMCFNLSVKKLLYEVPVEGFLSKREKLKSEYRAISRVVSRQESIPILSCKS
jgi:hypothetical protein